MPEKSSPSVKVFYPKHNTADLVTRLQAKLEEIERLMPVKLMALFGSYAKGNYTVASDIDVLLVYRGPVQEDAYRKARRVLDIPGIELHVYSEDDYQALKPTIDRMLKGSIPILKPGTTCHS